MPTRSLSAVEKSNHSLLSKAGMAFALLFVTGNGLDKSVLDATDEIRQFLDRQGIHDYEKQGLGPVHRVHYPSLIGLDRMQSRASLYRPVTKRGAFSRLWFTQLKSYCEDDDVLAIIALKVENEAHPILWLVNLTRERSDEISPLLGISGEAPEIPERTPDIEISAPNISAQLEMLLRGGPGLRGVPPSWLAVDTKLDRNLRPAITDNPPTLVVLSGNAGDGKTAFIEGLLSSVDVPVIAGQNVYENVPIGVGNYMVVMDGSEDSPDLDNDKLLLNGLKPFAGPDIVLDPPRGLLIAINKGRLLEFLEKYATEFSYLSEITQHVFVTDSKADLGPYKFVDLNNRSLLSPDEENSFLGRIIKRIDDWEAWEDCERCPAVKICPIQSNKRTIGSDSGSQQVWRLFDAIDLDDRVHLTARHIVASIVALVLSNNTCEEVRAIYEERSFEKFSPEQHIYNNLFSGPDARTNLSKSISEAANILDPSQIHSPSTDRFVASLLSESETAVDVLGLNESERSLSNQIESIGASDKSEDNELLESIGKQVSRRSYLTANGGISPTEFHQSMRRSDIPLVSIDRFRESVISKEELPKTTSLVIKGLNGLMGAPSDIEDLIVPRSSDEAIKGTVFATRVPRSSIHVLPESSLGSASTIDEWVELRPRNLVMRVSSAGKQVHFLSISLSLFDVIAQAAVGRLPYGQTGRDVLARVRGGYSRLSTMQVDDQSTVLFREGRVVGAITIEGLFVRGEL